MNDKNTLPLGTSFDECERTFIFPLLHCVSIILCLPVLLTFKIFAGIPFGSNHINSGLIPISVLEKFDSLIFVLVDISTPSIATEPLLIWHGNIFIPGDPIK